MKRLVDGLKTHDEGGADLKYPLDVETTRSEIFCFNKRAQSAELTHARQAVEKGVVSITAIIPHNGKEICRRRENLNNLEES